MWVNVPMSNFSHGCPGVGIENPPGASAAAVDFRQSRTVINSDTYSLLPIGVRFRGQSGHTPDIADASKTAAEAALIQFGQSS
jgi:hypothetical protein